MADPKTNPAGKTPQGTTPATPATPTPKPDPAVPAAAAVPAPAPASRIEQFKDYDEQSIRVLGDVDRKSVV